MFKNVASQKIAFYAYDATTGVPKTGDAANLTGYVSKDWGSVTVLGDTSATEMDSTNAKGMYLFDLTQGETNANCLIFTAKSSTSDIYLAPITLYTDPPNYTAFALSAGGVVTADVDTIKTNAVVNGGTITFPTNSTLASTTNITAGTITTVTNLTNAATAGDLTATMKASVNAEMVDVLAVDTYAEPGQAAPGATTTLAVKINYLYKAWRNKVTQTATEFSLFADNASTVDQKATVSDDATTFTRGEIASGP